MAYNPFRHPGLKLTACALAALLWLTVAGEHVVERIIRVPLEFRSAFRTHRTLGNHLLKILLPAFRTFRRGRIV
jgi:hypothetical protein